MQGLNAAALERRISEEGFTALTPPQRAAGLAVEFR